MINFILQAMDIIGCVVLSLIVVAVICAGGMAAEYWGEIK